MSRRRVHVTDADARGADRDGPRRDAHRRGRGRHRQDDRARRAHRPRHRGGTRRRPRDRRRDVHREGGRRAEAAAARAARSRAARAGDRCRGARGSMPPCRTSRRRTSAPSTGSAPICCASGRSRRASIRCSACSPRASPSGCSTRRSIAGSRRSSKQPAEGVRRSLRRGSRGLRPGERDEDGPMERLRRAGFELVQWRDFTTRRGRASLRSRAGLARLRRAGAHARRRCRRTRRMPATICSSTRRRSGVSVRICARSGDSDDLGRPRGAARSICGGTATSSGCAKASARPTRRVCPARRCSGRAMQLVLALDDFQVRADADLAALLQQELQACVDGIRAAEGAGGRARLPRSPAARAQPGRATTQSVRRHFQQRFKRLFVDEFQDTDPLQAELLLLLAADDPAQTRWQRCVARCPGKLFIVGDPKQSIYRFRRADVDVYRTRLRAAAARTAPRSCRCGGASAACRTFSARSTPRSRRSWTETSRSHAGALHAARAVARACMTRSRRSSRCRCRSRMARGSSRRGRSRRRCRTRSARSSTGWCARAAGR